jgi:DNA-binding NarL/FixJ family response regulator
MRDHNPADAGEYDRLAPSRGANADSAIRVMVAADHALGRAGYRALLERDHSIEVVAEAADLDDAIRLARDSQPQVALLDLALAGLDDPEAIAAIASHHALAGVAVIMIAPPHNDERILGALRAGAIGVLADDAEPAELIGAVQLVAAGQALLPARAMRRLLHELAPHHSARGSGAERFDELTDREREIVGLAAAGLSNAEIAERLVISTATAKTHVSRAMIKVHARHRAQLVAIAYESGLARAPVHGSPDFGAAVSSLTAARVAGMNGPR